MSDRTALALAVLAGLGAWAAVPVPLPVGVAVAAAALAARRPWLLCVGAALLASGLAARSWAGLEAPLPARVEGTVTLVSDPEWVNGALRLHVAVDGRRYEAWARRPHAGSLVDLLAGERVVLAGTVRRPSASARRWLAPRHVAGVVTIHRVGASSSGGAVVRVANGVRRTLERGAAPLGERLGALFSGFLLGDDRRQGADVTDEFRAAGLSHLLAVSGQNVALVLALAGPGLRRLGLRGRTVATVGVIAFFGLITRWEPSVLRASAMAGLAVTAWALGRPATGLRLLALAVSGLLLVDPLLVHSVGFLMSAGASAAILLLARPLAARLPGPRPLADALGVTVAAQLGVAPVAVPVFGGMPFAALPANLLAGPAAGPITAWGATAGLAAGALGGTAAEVLHVPTRLLVGWVAEVARVSAELPLGQVRTVHLVGGLVGAAGVVVARRRPAWARAVLVTTLACLAAVPFVVPTGPAAGPRPLTGGRLWRGGEARVLVVDGPGARLLDELRAAGVSRVDAVVVTVADPTGDGAAVARRLGARLVLGPAGVPGAVTPATGSVVAVGDLRIRVRSGGASLRVEVEDVTGER